MGSECLSKQKTNVHRNASNRRPEKHGTGALPQRNDSVLSVLVGVSCNKNVCMEKHGFLWRHARRTTTLLQSDGDVHTRVATCLFNSRYPQCFLLTSPHLPYYLSELGTYILSHASWECRRRRCRVVSTDRRTPNAYVFILGRLLEPTPF